MRAFASSFRIAAAAVGLGVLAVPAVHAGDASLTVTYAGNAVTFDGAGLAILPHQDVKAYDAHEKMEHVYSGVPVRDLLARDGVVFGEKLRGKSLRLVVIAHCRDHYDIVFALAEFDDAFNARTILLVDRQDGQPLPDGQGPLRLVVPGDKRPARWARMVTSLEVVSAGGSTGP
jgi:DMSO/TMAO reductase YedYZ molybdopterin-dependent catalytic subunit